MNANILSAVLIIIGVGIFFFGIRGRAGLPPGRMIYIDSAALRHSQTLYDPELDLSGRPDYVIRHRRGIVPVEMKSTAAPAQPHDGHILQLAAYCQLIETGSLHRPPFGVIRYRDQAFRIKYTQALRKTLHKTLRTMREWGTDIPDRSHTQAGRCQACGYRSSCDQVI